LPAPRFLIVGPVDTLSPWAVTIPHVTSPNVQMKPIKKSPSGVIEFPDPQAAIDGFIDVWLPRLVRSNQILTVALLRVREHLRAEGSSGASQILAEVEKALEKAERVESGA
jgi:hypothetical protein